MDPITRRDIEFRMAEILGWVRVSIRQGNEQQARTWGAALARVGNRLLDDPVAHEHRCDCEFCSGKQAEAAQTA